MPSPARENLIGVALNSLAAELDASAVGSLRPGRVENSSAKESIPQIRSWLIIPGENSHKPLRVGGWERRSGYSEHHLCRYKRSSSKCMAGVVHSMYMGAVRPKHSHTNGHTECYQKRFLTASTALPYTSTALHVPHQKASTITISWFPKPRETFAAHPLVLIAAVFGAQAVPGDGVREGGKAGCLLKARYLLDRKQGSRV